MIEEAPLRIKVASSNKARPVIFDPPTFTQKLVDLHRE
jgi:hypothetical protein